MTNELIFGLQGYVYNRLSFRFVVVKVFIIATFSVWDYCYAWIFFCLVIFSSYGWYFTFVQGFVYLALIHLQGFTIKQMVNPWGTYVKLSGVLMGSHGLTKGSLAYLNYPAQIMFKSTKVWAISCHLVLDIILHNFSSRWASLFA